jgi:DNA-binding XRE family transcriptional regulator
LPPYSDEKKKERVSVLAYKVGRCLLSLRLKEAGMDQTDLAYRLNVTKQQINKYATNRQRMSLETAKNISSILGCSMEDLYEWIWVEEETGKIE